MSTPEPLHRALARLAGVRVLLVASDYDGTLADIVDDPDRAFPVPESMAALADLAGCPRTHVAVVSGRSLHDLGALSGAPDGVRLVGSHGSEFGPGGPDLLDDGQRAVLADVVAELRAIAADVEGCHVETKPAGVAFHFRRAAPGRGEQAEQAVLAGPATRPGVHVRHGKKVVELSMVGTNKGDALGRLRELVGADAALFVGDDVTDEDAFASLLPGDVGVKVGPGDTAATHRVDDTAGVAGLLAELAALRSPSP